MPSYRDTRVDMTLTNFVRNYPFTQLRAVADIVAPVKQVPSSIGHIKQYGREFLNVNIADTLSQRGKANEIRFEVSDGHFECIPYGLKTFVSDKEINQSMNALDPMKQATLLLMHALKLRNEIRVADFALASVTSSTFILTPAQDWDNAAATIVADINLAKAALKTNMGGVPATHILFGDHIADEMCGQATIIAMIQTAAALGNPQNIWSTLTSDALPPTIMGLTKLVPNMYYDNAVEGHATEHLLHSWGDAGYLFHIDPGAETATWAIQPESMGVVITKYRENDPPGWWIRAEWERDIVEINANAIHQEADLT